MAKTSIEPAGGLHPAPVLLVSCGTLDDSNILTIAWAGTLASDPPLLSISVRPNRYSHKIILDAGEFVANVCSSDQVRAADALGLVSGRNVDKFKLANFTPVPASVVKAPMIKECPINLECVVRDAVKANSHDIFISQIVAAHVDENLLGEAGNLPSSSLKPLLYFNHNYFDLGTHLGQFGFSKKRI